MERNLINLVHLMSSKFLVDISCFLRQWMCVLDWST